MWYFVFVQPFMGTSTHIQLLWSICPFSQMTRDVRQISVTQVTKPKLTRALAQNSSPSRIQKLSFRTGVLKKCSKTSTLHNFFWPTSIQDKSGLSNWSPIKDFFLKITCYNFQSRRKIMTSGEVKSVFQVHHMLVIDQRPWKKKKV